MYNVSSCSGQHGRGYGNQNGANNAHYANDAENQSDNHYDKDSYIHYEVRSKRSDFSTAIETQSLHQCAHLWPLL